MLLLNLSAITVLFTAVSAHMAFSIPCPRYGSSQDCPEPPPGESVDYDIISPIGTHGGINMPICRHSKPYPSPVATWRAGETVQVKFVTGATHGGGHCQFALSYDDGDTFVVIHDRLRHCFFDDSDNLDPNFDIPLPADLPGSDKVVFAWGWNNALGNREFYMNCADIKIEGTGSSLTGPKMLFANYGPDNPYIPEFNGNYDTGVELFEQRPTITVTP